MIVSTHLGEVDKLCTKNIILNEGGVAQGTLDDLPMAFGGRFLHVLF